MELGPEGPLELRKEWDGKQRCAPKSGVSKGIQSFQDREEGTQMHFMVWKEGRKLKKLGSKEQDVK